MAPESSVALRFPRLSWPLLLIVLLTRSIGYAAEPSALDYWPMEPGMTWIYTGEGGGQQVVRVVGQEHLDDELVTVIERQKAGEKTSLRSYYAVRDGAVLLLAFQQHGGPNGGSLRRYAAPVVVWPATVALGTRWNSSASTQLEIQRQETISVPAGTFQCLVVVSTSPTGETGTAWMAPGVGMVQAQKTGPDGRRLYFSQLKGVVVPSDLATPAEPF